MASPMLLVLPKSPMHQAFAVKVLGYELAFNLAVNQPMMYCHLCEGDRAE